MNIAVIGSSGRMGGTICNILSKSHHTVIGIDRHNLDILEDVIDLADIAIIATPFDVTCDYLSRLSSRLKCIEVTSAKTPMLRFAGDVISIHPLFGPGSFKTRNLRNIVFVSDISPVGSLKLVKELFSGYNVISMKAKEHDELISKIQVIPYIISLLSEEVNVQTNLSTRSKGILDSMSSICKDQNRKVLIDTIVRNPFSLGVLKDIEEKLNKLGGELSDRCSDVWLQH